MRRLDPLAILCLVFLHVGDGTARPTASEGIVSAYRLGQSGTRGLGDVDRSIGGSIVRTQHPGMVFMDTHDGNTMGKEMDMKKESHGSGLGEDEVDHAALADPPRLPSPPGASVTEGEGWLSRWLALGGEGEVNVILGKQNLTFPHRPAAFPSQLLQPMTLPIAGILQPFTSFLTNTSSPSSPSPSPSPGSSWGPPSPPRDPTTQRHQPHRPLPSLSHSPTLGCIPPQFPPRYAEPPRPWRIALVERGECDFASKVRAAQDRGAAGVVVGDCGLPRETDEEGMERESLITMFSPEDTDAIFIPSVFVSRATYLTLRNLLGNGTTSGKGYEGLWIEIGEGEDDGATLSSLLSFALLMPSLFLCATIAIHRFRVARQREADRAPPLVVLSLPERVWSPDIVWEKESDSGSDEDDARGDPEDEEDDHPPASPKSISTATASLHTAPSSPIVSPAGSSVPPDAAGQHITLHVASVIVPPPPPFYPLRVSEPPLLDPALDNASGSKNPAAGRYLPTPSNAAPVIPPPPPIHPHQISTPPLLDPDQAPLAHASGSKKRRTKSGLSGRSGRTAAKKYFSKDECAICMDSFTRGDVVRILPCGHVFHKDECDEWLLKWRKLCPTCRADVTLPPGDVRHGATITPVIGSAGGEQPRGLDQALGQDRVGDEGRGIVSRLNEMVRSRWDSLVGRRGIRVDEEEGEAEGEGGGGSQGDERRVEVGERTPLIRREGSAVGASTS